MTGDDLDDAASDGSIYAEDLMARGGIDPVTAAWL
jgi:hypothetical protein